MQLSNQCCNLVFSCMQQNLKNLKSQFEKDKARFLKIQNENENASGDLSAKLKNCIAENKMLRNEMNLMRLNLDWTHRRNQILKNKLVHQEKTTQEAVHVAVENATETFKVSFEIMNIEMNRATKLNDNLKSEIEMLKAKVKYFKSDYESRSSVSPKRQEVLLDDISNVSSMAKFQWKLNSLTGNSDTTFYPESFVDGKQAYASKEFDSYDSDLDSMETVDAIWMEDQISRLGSQIEEITRESNMIKNELKMAKKTISKLTKDLCSVILSSKG